MHRFQFGKNFWKFDFNRGHRFQAKDEYGNEYETKWSKLNFSSLIQQVNFQHRGEQGLFEGVGFRLFELCGVEASKTHHVQFYVIDQARPASRSMVQTTMGCSLPSNSWTDSFSTSTISPTGTSTRSRGTAGSRTTKAHPGHEPVRCLGVCQRLP